jgi:hypothetical protein
MSRMPKIRIVAPTTAAISHDPDSQIAENAVAAALHNHSSQLPGDDSDELKPAAIGNK